jgi:hypothetical protein
MGATPKQITGCISQLVAGALLLLATLYIQHKLEIPRVAAFFILMAGGAVLLRMAMVTLDRKDKTAQQTAAQKQIADIESTPLTIDAIRRVKEKELELPSRYANIVHSDLTDKYPHRILLDGWTFELISYSPEQYDSGLPEKELSTALAFFHPLASSVVRHGDAALIEEFERVSASRRRLFTIMGDYQEVLPILATSSRTSGNVRSGDRKNRLQFKDVYANAWARLEKNEPSNPALKRFAALADARLSRIREALSEYRAAWDRFESGAIAALARDSTRSSKA